MRETAHRIYRIYNCNRCKLGRVDYEPRPKDWSLKWRWGWCKADGKEVPVMIDPQYDLTPVAPDCDDFTLGKPRKKRPGKKEKDAT